jgi:hypothetical protein
VAVPTVPFTGFQSPVAAGAGTVTTGTSVSTTSAGAWVWASVGVARTAVAVYELKYSLAWASLVALTDTVVHEVISVETSHDEA